jgi:RimJ/RimL family protein N-acetyltransferase
VGEIGYFLHPDWWGQGFGTEISTALLRFGFQKLHLHRLLATCDPRNTASKRVLEKIGMVYERDSITPCASVTAGATLISTASRTTSGRPSLNDFVIRE